MIYNKYKAINMFCISLFMIGIIQNTSCGVYSFSGISIPSEIKTVYVQYIENKASLIEPNLSNTITEKLKTKCLNEAGLIWKESNSDVIFSGEIKKYQLEPIAIQENEIAAKNRLTISVEITYINKYDESKNFNKLFSDYIDIESDQNFYDQESELNNTITTNIIEDIFNAAFLNW